MAENDWAFVDSSLSAAQVARGVTGGFTPPAGGGAFVFGFNSLVDQVGFTGLFVNKTNFAPLRNNAAAATGGSIRGAMKKAVSAANTGYAPFFFICLRAGASLTPNPSTSDVGYLFGLENNDPARIVLRKGSPIGGMPTSGSSILRSSNAAFAVDQWLHLRVDVITNPNGDVVIKFFQNDLTVLGASVQTPTWIAISGMSDFVDDALGITSGLSPLSGGFVGFGMWSSGLQRRSYFDHLEVFREI